MAPAPPARVPPAPPDGERAPVGAYVICLDEADVIGDCLASLGFAQEIVVVDSGSTDGTQEVVEGFREAGWPVRLVHNPWPGYARQKQFAMDELGTDWALCLDADERLDEALAREIPRAVASAGDAAAFRLRRRLWLHGHGWAHPATHLGTLVRLTRQGRARYDFETLVHEHIHVDGPVRTLRTGAILHRGALPAAEQLAKENGYAALKAEQLFRAGRGPRLAKMVLNPPFHFLRRYLLERYCLNGWAGFVHSVTGAIYAFQTEAILLDLHRAAREDGEG